MKTSKSSTIPAYLLAFVSLLLFIGGIMLLLAQFFFRSLDMALTEGFGTAQDMVRFVGITLSFSLVTGVLCLMESLLLFGAARWLFKHHTASVGTKAASTSATVYYDFENQAVPAEDIAILDRFLDEEIAVQDAPRLVYYDDKIPNYHQANEAIKQRQRFTIKVIPHEETAWQFMSTTRSRRVTTTAATTRWKR